MTEPIILNFKYKRDEYIKAARFHFTRTMTLKLDIAVATFTALVALLSLKIDGISWLSVSAICVTVLLLLVVFCALFVVPAQMYKGSEKLKQDYELVFSEEGIKFKTADIDSNLKWDLYKRWIENQDFFILYHGKNEFSVIPKRVFKDHAELNGFKELIKRKIDRNS